MAAAFLAMNAVFGCRSFDVDPAEVLEPGAIAEKWPKKEFIFDVQTDHFAAGRIIETPPLLRYREFGGIMRNESHFGLSAAKIYGIDPAAKLRALPDDALTKLKTAYRAAGARPSNTQYGWWCDSGR